MFAAVWVLLSLGALGSAEELKGCTITAAGCKNFPEFRNRQFRDFVGEENLGSGGSEAACLKRAEDFHHWCGNGVDSGAQVGATFNPAQWSQVYHPGACEAGWSQWDAFCYKHYWEKRNWFEAERLCRERDAHLASIHSRAENRFIYTLTSGLSAWIGYTDLDQDTHYSWSDSTQDDFSNFAKNCTGRENEPDCKPEEKKQQWYDWEGGDAGTFICKRNALLPMHLLKNVTAKDLSTRPWGTLLAALNASSAVAKQLNIADADALSLKSQDLLSETKGPSSLASPSAPEPRLGLPKGSLF